MTNFIEHHQKKIPTRISFTGLDSDLNRCFELFFTDSKSSFLVLELDLINIFEILNSESFCWAKVRIWVNIFWNLFEYRIIFVGFRFRFESILLKSFQMQNHFRWIQVQICVNSFEMISYLTRQKPYHCLTDQVIFFLSGFWPGPPVARPRSHRLGFFIFFLKDVFDQDVSGHTTVCKTGFFLIF